MGRWICVASSEWKKKAYSLNKRRYKFNLHHKIGNKLILNQIKLCWFYSLPVCSLDMNNLSVIMVPELTQQKQRICTKDASFKVSETDKFGFMNFNTLFIHCNKSETNFLTYIKTMYLLDMAILICHWLKLWLWNSMCKYESWDVVRESKANFSQ